MNALSVWSSWTLGVILGSIALGMATASAQDAGHDKVPIAIFVSGLTSFTQPALDDVKKEFADQVSFTVYNDNFNPQTQVSQCQDAITTRKYKGFIVYPTDGGSMGPCTKAAIAAGIKVASWDYPPIGPDPLSEEIQVPGQIGMDLVSLRVDVKAAVDMTVAACGAANPCNVAMLVAIPTFGYTAVKRKLELEAYGKLPQIHVVSESVIGFDAPDKAEAAIRTALLKNPNINVIIGDDDSSLQGAERAVTRAGKAGQIKLIGDGANQYGVKAVSEGRWFGTVVNLPATGVKTATQMLLAAIAGKPVEQPIVINQLQETVCSNAQVIQACASQIKAEW